MWRLLNVPERDLETHRCKRVGFTVARVNWDLTQNQVRFWIAPVQVVPHYKLLEQPDYVKNYL